MFQDAYASLDPRMQVGSSLREPLMIQHIGNRAASSGPGSLSCWTVSACRGRQRTATRTSSPAASASASAWPGRWR